MVFSCHEETHTWAENITVQNVQFLVYCYSSTNCPILINFGAIHLNTCAFKKTKLYNDWVR